MMTGLCWLSQVCQVYDYQSIALLTKYRDNATAEIAKYLRVDQGIELDVAALNRLASQMQERLDEQITDRLVKEFEERHKDKISMIVITRLASPGSVLVCRYEGKRYALISLDDWVKSKGNYIHVSPVFLLCNKLVLSNS